MQRLKLVIAYDGRPFAGWQSQASGNAIQDQLEAAFRGVSGKSLRVHGAGRTDAGVHALGQCAHVDVPARGWPADKWSVAVNARLPAEIRIMRATYVGPGFHARYSAVSKTYRYRIWNERVLPPLELGRAWHIPKTLDVTLMQRAVALFEGRHDFAAFAANRGSAEKSTVRTIARARLCKRGREIAVEISGDGFLYKMVRLIVAAAVECGHEKVPVTAIQARLEGPGEAAKAGARPVAPAEGLFLVRVRY